MAMSKIDYCNIPVVYTRVTTEHHHNMRQWLVDNIDPECYDAEDFSSINDDFTKRTIWFANHKDAVWFKLVWA
jgi:hypothetical protein